ncbi:DinB family protein [Aquimarina aquimarini]|uniref:DinB family protein n=1 Tax=Aquimarina aquimarini TaxID=1191734 RepID=UPI000D55853A|nr:DinB family protein [Aquimarina aquimarini]
MQDPLIIARVNRKALEKMLDHYSIDQLNKIPEGFKNNLIWNIAHVIVTQQLLVYKLSGLPMMVSDQMVDLYKKGTKPERNVTVEEVAEIKELLFTTLDKTEKDLSDDVFKSYNEYTTSAGFVLTSAQNALTFNDYHEGLHLGYAMALRKLL